VEFSCAAVMTIHAQKDLMLGKAQPFNIVKAKTGPVTPPLPLHQFSVTTHRQQCEIWVCAELTGVLLTLFFVWNVTKSVRRVTGNKA